MTPAEQLMEAALAPTRLALVRKPKRAKTPREPRGLARRYERALTAVSVAMAREAQRQLAPARGATATDAPRADVTIDLGLVFAAFPGLRVGLSRIVARALPILDRFGRQVAAENAAEMSRVLGIPIPDQGPVVESFVDQWRRENVALVSSIADRLHDDLFNLITEASTSGMRSATLAKRIEERYRVSGSRARLIARDQILKGNGALTRARQLEAGITEYEWITSRDERVRPEHRDLNGRVFSWNDPPNTGNGRNHPGGDIQCRCTARPRL